MKVKLRPKKYLSAYKGEEARFEPCTSKIGSNWHTTKATTKCFRFCIFSFHIQYSIGNKCIKPCAQNHGLSLWFCACKPMCTNPWF